MVAEKREEIQWWEHERDDNASGIEAQQGISGDKKKNGAVRAVRQDSLVISASHRKRCL